MVRMGCWETQIGLVWTIGLGFGVSFTGSGRGLAMSDLAVRDALDLGRLQLSPFFLKSSAVLVWTSSRIASFSSPLSPCSPQNSPLISRVSGRYVPSSLLLSPIPQTTTRITKANPKFLFIIQIWNRLETQFKGEFECFNLNNPSQQIQNIEIKGYYEGLGNKIVIILTRKQGDVRSKFSHCYLRVARSARNTHPLPTIVLANTPYPPRIYNILFQSTPEMLSLAQTAMMIEEPNPIFSLIFQTLNVLQELTLDKRKKIHRIVLGRKQPKSHSNQTEIQSIVVPNNPRLSSEHAYITIKRKNIEAHLKILNIILKQRLQNQLLKMIIDYLYSDFDVTIRDLGSNCGTYIPKNRLLGIQQFWLLQDHPRRDLSFGVYFLSTPGEFQRNISNASLIQHIQRCNVVSDNSTLKERAQQCKFEDPQQIEAINSAILDNYAVAILSHQQNGYVFIKNPQNQEISIEDYFVARIAQGKLRVESSLQVYTNICNDKTNPNNKYSDAFRIKARECLVIGEERCYLTIKD